MCKPFDSVELLVEVIILFVRKDGVHLSEDLILFYRFYINELLCDRLSQGLHQPLRLLLI